MGSSGGNLKTTLKVKIYDTELQHLYCEMSKDGDQYTVERDCRTSLHPARWISVARHYFSYEWLY